MRAKTTLLLAFVQATFPALILPVAAQAPAAPYPAMAPLAQYLMPESDEIALARSGAPAEISKNADVMVLRKDGYATAAKGTNGFLCIVERGWANDTSQPDFWNPKLRAPNCFNHAAATTFEQIYLMKTRLVLEGKTKEEIVRATAAAMDSKKLPPLAPGAMCYMMSKQQYLGDRDKAWHPHLMFFVAGDAAKSWGADAAGSPLIAANDPEERVTIFMMVVGNWSDGSPGASVSH
jgi:hypothetical protein